MKTFKKLFAFTAIFALLATLVPTYAFAASYSSELEGAYDYAFDNGITTQSSIDNADMYGSLTRIAMAKMIANYAVDVLELTPDTTKECSFPDVSEALDAQYDNGVTNACQLGLMGVGVTNFDPYGLVNRAQFGTVLSRALYGEDNNGGNPYYADHLNALEEAGIMNNISNPDMLEVRGYVMLMMQRGAEDTTTEGCSAEELLACITADDYDECMAACSDVEEEEEETLAGELEVSLDSSTPSTKYVPGWAQNVKFASFQLDASDEDVTLKGLTFKRIWVGSRNDFAGVYLRINNVAITNERTVNTDNKVEFAINNYEIKKWESVVVDVYANMATSTNANSQNGFALLDDDSINSTAKDIGGNFPVEGKLMTMSDVKVADMKITSTVQASDPTLGQTNVTLWTIKLENVDSNNTDHAIKLETITLEQAGTIDVDSLDNLALYDGTTKVAEMQEIYKDDYVLVFDNFTLNDWNTRTLDLKWDIVDGKAWDTIAFALNDNSDVVAEDVDAWIWATVKVDSTTQSSPNYISSETLYVHNNNGGISTLTLKAADVSLSFEGPVTKDIAWGDTSIVLLESKITSQRNIEVKQLDVALLLTKTAAANSVPTTSLKNIKIVDSNGNTLMGPVSDLETFGFTDANDDNLIDNAAATQTVTKWLTDSFYVNAGKTKIIRVVADLSSTSDVDLTKISSDITLWSSSIKDTDTNKYITTASITPTTVAGKTHNIVNNSLTLSAASTPAATTLIKGSSDVKIGGLSLRAGDAGAMKLKSIKFTFAGVAANTAKDIFNSLKLVTADGTVLDASNITDATPDTITFDGFSYEIAKWTTQILYVKADVLSTAGATSLNLSVAAVADVSAVESDGDALTVTWIPSLPTMTIAGNGSFTVSPLTVVSKDQIVQAGSADVLVAKYELKSAQEAFNVKKLTFEFAGSPEIISSVKLVIGTVEKTEYSITANEVTFANINAEVNWTVEAKLYVTYNAMNSEGTDTGKWAKFIMAQDDDSTETEVIGLGSSTTINDLTAFVDTSTNKTYYTRNSKLTFAKSLVAKTMMNDGAETLELYKFTVTNWNGGSIDLWRLAVKFVTAWGTLSLANLAVYKNWTKLTTATFDTATAPATAATTRYVTFTSNADWILSAWETATFLIKGDTVTSANGNSVSVDILDDDAGPISTNTKAAIAAANNFARSDKAMPAHTDATLDWANGYGFNLDILDQNSFGNDA